jgi:hypothetical protein
MTWFDAVTGEPLRCVTCDRALDGDPDEDPTGDAGRPICGDCRRAVEFDAIDMLDGVLDGDYRS